MNSRIASPVRIETDAAHDRIRAAGVAENGMAQGALRVRLDSTLRRDERITVAPLALLEAGGPLACVGGAAIAVDALPVPVTPGPTRMFGPRGACRVGESLWACDTGHHRLLGWARVPSGDDAPADWVIGQADFSREGRNAKSNPGAATFNVPTGICACGEGMAVADAWNHRVLIWHRMPTASHTPADLVLGQAGFSTMQSNRGDEQPSASSLFWPYNLHWDGTRLWVADTGNRRVLMWRGLPVCNGQPANLVLGQAGLGTRDENGGDEPDAASLRWPHAVTHWRGKLCVADAGNNRILVWDEQPDEHNRPADHALGQSGFVLVDHNQSRYWPDADSLNMPYGMSAHGDWLLVADTANSRLLGWHIDDCATGAAARALSAQPDFGAKGDNRWGAPVRDSLCWPYGILAFPDDDRIIVADSGNNRVLLWRMAPGLEAAR